MTTETITELCHHTIFENSAPIIKWPQNDIKHCKVKDTPLGHCQSHMSTHFALRSALLELWWNLSLEKPCMHCCERPHVFKVQISWQKILHFNTIEPVTKVHLSWETTFVWPIGVVFRDRFYCIDHYETRALNDLKMTFTTTRSITPYVLGNQHLSIPESISVCLALWSAIFELQYTSNISRRLKCTEWPWMTFTTTMSKVTCLTTVPECTFSLLLCTEPFSSDKCTKSPQNDLDHYKVKDIFCLQKLHDCEKGYCFENFEIQNFVSAPYNPQMSLDSSRSKVPHI